MKTLEQAQAYHKQTHYRVICEHCHTECVADEEDFDSFFGMPQHTDDVCKYSFPIIEHFVRHYTGPETDTFEIDANTKATPQFTQDGFEKEMHKEYDKSQCVYGKDSTMPCMFCSATCQARYKDFTEKGVKIVEIPVKANVPDSNGCVYSKEALENAVKEYMEKKKEEGEITHEVFFGPYKSTEDGRLIEVDFGEIYNDMFGKEQTIDKEIKEQAHWLANNFSTRNGYTSMEENLIKMGEFVKNRILDKYNLENDNKN